MLRKVEKRKNICKKNSLRDLKQSTKGITLIALVITIIILIILAGVSIRLIIGKNGIIERAKASEKLNEEQASKERLEMDLASLYVDKEIGLEYSDEIFDSYLTSKGYIVNGNIVIVDEWQFQVDKTVPKLVESLGKGEEIQQIDITTKVEYASDYTKANLQIGITYEGNIAQVKINGEEIEILEKTEGTYRIEKEILTNGNYSIYIKDENDAYKLTSVAVEEISENMIIETVEELIAFRDRVNKGATYEGKTITLTHTLNLSDVCNENIGSWIPIGDTNSTQFKGTFDGNNNIISNIYINTSENNRLGLFGINGGTIKNLIITEGSITTIRDDRAYIGGICGINKGEISDCINESVVIYQKINATKEAEGPCSGGIAGMNQGTIKKCGNRAKVESTATTYVTNVAAGGIVATNYAQIEQCYNKAEITCISGRNANGGGIAGANENGNIKECYNLGKIVGDETKSGALYMGGIVGLNRNTIDNCYSAGIMEKKSTTDKYNIGISLGYQIGKDVTRCYYLKGLGYTGYGAIDTSVPNTVTTVTPPKTSDELKNLASTLGSAFTNDTNGGYPILKWEIKE